MGRERDTKFGVWALGQAWSCFQLELLHILLHCAKSAITLARELYNSPPHSKKIPEGIMANHAHL